MGRVVESDDIELVDAYMVELAGDSTLRRVERWAMAAQVRDLLTDQTLYIPSRCPLKRTSSIILEHLGVYSDGSA